MGPTSNANQFFGVKVSQTGTPVNQAADSQLVYKSNFSTNLFNGSDGVWKVMEGTRAPTTGNGLITAQQGFWVAEDGIDVQQATDAQMIFNSNTNLVSSAQLLNPYKFRAIQTASFNFSSSFTILKFDTKDYDTSSNYSTSTGLFTAPIAGFYHFDAYARTLQGSGGHRVLIALYKNATLMGLGSDGSGVGGVLFFNGSQYSDTIQMAVGDTAQIQILADTGLGGDVSSPEYNRFSGFLVSAF